MSKMTIVINVGAIVLCLMAVAGRSDAGSEERSRSFVATAKQVRGVWQEVKPRRQAIPPSNLAAAQASLAKWDKASPSASRTIVRYLMGRVTFLSGQKEAAESQLVSSMAVSTAPEVVLALMELHSESLDKRLLYAQYLAEILPLSTWRKQHDGRHSEVIGFIKPPRQAVPRANKKMVIELAVSLERAGLHDLAWRAYAEAIYAGFTTAWIKERLEETWLSPQAAEYWYKAAECAHRAGKEKLAWDYLTKAAVFGTDKLCEEAQATAKRWANAKPGITAKPVAAGIKRKALLRAVQLYAEMNAHPRAWALIDANRDVFENPDRLRKEVEEKWLAVVKDVSRAANKVTLYGHEVYPKIGRAHV